MSLLIDTVVYLAFFFGGGVFLALRDGLRTPVSVSLVVVVRPSQSKVVIYLENGLILNHQILHDHPRRLRYSHTGYDVISYFRLAYIEVRKKTA